MNEMKLYHAQIEMFTTVKDIYMVAQNEQQVINIVCQQYAGTSKSSVSVTEIEVDGYMIQVTPI